MYFLILGNCKFDPFPFIKLQNCNNIHKFAVKIIAFFFDNSNKKCCSYYPLTIGHLWIALTDWLFKNLFILQIDDNKRNIITGIDFSFANLVETTLKQFVAMRSVSVFFRS